MSETAVTIQIPDSVYQRLNEVAEASGWTLEAVILQSVRAGMPPLLKKVPDKFHAELLALNKMDDQALWEIGHGDRSFDDSGEARQADLGTLRRAYAYALLRWRGHPLPDPHEFLL
jgi:hypothetical protein